MALVTKPCENCGKPVTRTDTRHLQRKYWACGRSCAGLLRVRDGTPPGWQPNRFRGIRETRPCVVCATPITRYVTEANHDQGWKCSRRCLAAFQAGRDRKRHGREVSCPRCGTPFYQQPSGRRQYCSVDCAHAMKASELLLKPCQHCGTEMRLRPSEQRTRFCSWNCTTLGKVKHATGRMHNGKPARKTHEGYVKIWEPGHPRSVCGWVLEHIWVMEQQLGRPISLSEEVDHKNRVRDDNRPENLQVLDKSAHRRKTGTDTRQERKTMRERLAEYERRFGPLT